MDTFHIENVSIYNLLKQKRSLNINGIFMTSPEITVISQPTKKKKEEPENKTNKLPKTYIAIKENVLPQLFELFYSFKVKKIELRNGNFDFLKHKNQENQETFTASNISVIFNNIYIDRENFEDSDLFTEDIEIKIADYSLNMKDKIHCLKSKNLYISTQQKIIQLNDIKLSPIKLKNLDTINKNIYSVNISEIEFNNSDFAQVYFDKKLNLTSAKISDMNINFYKQKKGKKIKREELHKDSISQKLDLQELLKGNIDEINIDTIYLVSGSFNLYNNIKDKKSNTSIKNIDLILSKFQIDSTSASDTTKILYADDISMNIAGFDLMMKDSIHSLSVEQLIVNTKDDEIWAKNFKMTPNSDKINFAISQNKELNTISIPGLKLKQINIHKYVNFNKLEIENIDIDKPEIAIKTFGKKEKKEKDSEVINLISSYLDGVYVNIINLDKGVFYYENKTEEKRTTTSGKINFTLYDFSLNPKNLDLTKFFFANNLEILFTDYKFSVAGDIHELNVDTLEISTLKSAITLKGFSFSPNIKENLVAIMRSNNKSVKINFTIPQLVINENNIHKALVNNELNISVIDIFSPQLKITSYPNIKAKKTKKDYIEKAKQNAILNIENQIDTNEIFVYDNILNFENRYSKKLQYKKDAVTAISDYATENIENLFVKVNDINTEDTVFQPIDSIINITLQSIYIISNDSLSYAQIDSIEYYSKNRISEIKKEVEQAKFDKDEIFAKIGSFLNIIDIDTFRVHDGNFRFFQQQNKISKEIFQNKLSLNMIDFYFNYDSLEQTANRFLFSKDIEVNLKNYKFYLKDEVHTVEIKDVKLSTLKSKIELKNIVLSPDSLKDNYKKIPSLIYADIPNTIITGFDLVKFYDEQILDIENFTSKNPKIFIIQQKDSTKTKVELKDYFLPREFKQISIKKFELDSGLLKISKKRGKKKNVFLKTNFRIAFCNFEIDSVLKINENPYFIPIKDLNFELSNLTFKLADSLHVLSFKNLSVTTKGGRIKLEDIKISHNHLQNNKESAKKTGKFSLMDIKIPSIEIKGAKLDKIKIDRLLIADTISVANPIFNIHYYSCLKNKPNKDRIKAELDSLSLYKYISKNLDQIINSNFIKNNIAQNYNKVKIDKLLISERINNEISITDIKNFNFLKKETKKTLPKFNLDSLDLYKYIHKDFNILSCKNFKINNISLNIINYKIAKIDTFSINKLSLNISKLLIDSTAKNTKFLYSDDITINLKDYSMPVKKIISNINIGNITLSTGNKNLILEDISLKPICKREDYAEKLGKKIIIFDKKENKNIKKIQDATVINLTTKNIEIKQIELAELINNYKIIAKYVYIDSLKLLTYKDLNKEHNYNTVKSRFLDYIFKTGVPYIKIDVVRIKNSYIGYEQLSKNAKATGNIYLTDFDATITTLTNDSVKIANGLKTTTISATAELMGNGAMEATIVYYLKSPNKYFTMVGSLVNADLIHLNEFLADAMNVEVADGKVDSIYFNFQGTDSIAKGYVKMKYKNVEAYYLKKEDENGERKRYKMLSKLGNALLVRNNNPRMGIYKKGRIGYFHDWSYGEVKFWIGALITGLTSTLVIEMPDSRKIHRQSRQQVKKTKRYERKNGNINKEKYNFNIFLNDYNINQNQ